MEPSAVQKDCHTDQPPTDEHDGESVSDSDWRLDSNVTSTPGASTRRKREPNKDNNAQAGPSRHPDMTTGNASFDATPIDERLVPPENNMRSLSLNVRSSTAAGLPSQEIPIYNMSTRPTRTGILENAQNFVIKNANIVDQTIYINGRSNEALQWLREHIMPGAEFDSSARDPPPRCHPGTRTAIIQRIENWLGDQQREKRLLWLHGLAGVGKSAIIQTLAESEADLNRLGASLFFSRPHDRNKPEKVFPTIAYQLAVRDASYKAYITELMADPMSLDKSMSEQFRRLFIRPFVGRRIRKGSEVLVIMLDGLDECGEEHQGQMQRKQHSSRYQCEIVRLISTFVQEHPSVPLIWIIASRPESHLKVVFSHDNVRPSFWEEEVPINSDEACRDVERYLRAGLDEIRQSYPDHISSLTWPSDGQFLKIATAVSGLFAFASVIICFIDDPWVGNPIIQLDSVLSTISKLTSSPDKRNPLCALDEIYAEILRRVPSDSWETTQKLIATRLGLGIHRGNLIYMCNMLNITRDSAATALRHLHSVVPFPRTADIGALRLKFSHASFQEYITDPSRSGKFFIGPNIIESAAQDWWLGTYRIMQQALFSHPEPASRISKITFSWAPEGEESKLTLAKQLFETADRSWRTFLEGPCRFHSYDQRYPGDKCPPPFHISTSITLRIIEEIDFGKLVGFYTPFQDSTRLFSFKKWFESISHLHSELERRQILSRTALSSLDVGNILRDRVKSLFKKEISPGEGDYRSGGWSHYEVGVFETSDEIQLLNTKLIAQTRYLNFDVPELDFKARQPDYRDVQPRVVAHIRQSVVVRGLSKIRVASSTEAMVLGRHHAKRCAMFMVTGGTKGIHGTRAKYTYILPCS